MRRRVLGGAFAVAAVLVGLAAIVLHCRKGALPRKVLDTNASEGPYQDAQDEACAWVPCCERDGK